MGGGHATEMDDAKMTEAEKAEKQRKYIQYSHWPKLYEILRGLFDAFRGELRTLHGGGREHV